MSKKAVLKKFAIFTHKHLCCSNFIEKGLQHKCFHVNVATVLRTPILKNTWERLIMMVTFKKPSKSKIQPPCKHFKANRGWFQKLSQRLSAKNFQSNKRKNSLVFRRYMPDFWGLENILLHLLASWMKCQFSQLFAKKGSKSIIVRTSECEKKHVTIF